MPAEAHLALEQIATERMVIPNPLSDDPNAGIVVAAGDPIPTFDVPTSGEAFDLDAATGKELDARFGGAHGYPSTAKVDERREFVRKLLASQD